jgi:hypothetical protein
MDEGASTFTVSQDRPVVGNRRRLASRSMVVMSPFVA